MRNMIAVSILAAVCTLTSGHPVQAQTTPEQPRYVMAVVK